jgi:hypothetical protein
VLRDAQQEREALFVCSPAFLPGTWGAVIESGYFVGCHRAQEKFLLAPFSMRIPVICTAHDHKRWTHRWLDVRECAVFDLKNSVGELEQPRIVGDHENGAVTILRKSPRGLP